MQTLSEIRELLADRGLRPRHRLGQHFLHDKNQLHRLVAAADISKDDLVLEVGPGTGTLTEALADAAAEVVACEVDADLAAIVEERLGSRVRLVVGDCLGRGRRLSPDVVSALDGRPFKLVANLPYEVAGTLMTTLLVHHPECAGQFVTIQREVADRLLAGPGGKEYGALSIIAGALGSVERIATLPATCFWPAPKVESAMVSIAPRRDHGIGDPESFAAFVVRLFTARRKQLGTTLGRNHPWPASIEPTQRPESLTVDQCIALWEEQKRV